MHLTLMILVLNGLRVIMSVEFTYIQCTSEKVNLPEKLIDFQNLQDIFAKGWFNERFLLTGIFFQMK